MTESGLIAVLIALSVTHDKHFRPIYLLLIDDVS